jgi:hypothetical protein
MVRALSFLLFLPVLCFGPNPIPFHHGNTAKPLLNYSTTGVKKFDKKPGAQFNCGCKLAF